MTITEIEKMFAVFEGKKVKYCKDGEGGHVITTDKGEDEDIAYSSDVYDHDTSFLMFSAFAKSPEIIADLLKRLKVAEEALEYYTCDEKVYFKFNSKTQASTVYPATKLARDALKKLRGEE